MTGDAVAATMRTYDRIALAYEQRAAPAGQQAEAAAHRLRADLSGDGPVVDLGCGPGLHAEMLQRLGFRVVGADLSAAMARRAGAHAPTVRADLRRPPFAAGSIAAVWSFAALLHVPSSDVAATLWQWRQLLPPGGHLVLSTALGDSEAWEAVPYDSAVRRWYVTRPAEALLADVRGAGFHVEHTDRHTTHRDWLTLHARAVPDA